jgi:hypothetical protein
VFDGLAPSASYDEGNTTSLEDAEMKKYGLFSSLKYRGQQRQYIG